MGFFDALFKPNVGKLKNKGDIEGLIRALKYHDSSIRAAAAGALVEIGTPAVEPLIAVLKDQDNNVRLAAAEALGKIKDVRAVDQLIATLKDQNKSGGVRCAAVDALGEIKDARAVEPLVALCCKDQDSYIREVAARALGKIKDASVVEPLIAILKDKDRDVRSAAAVALGGIKDARAVEALVNIDTSEKTRIDIFKKTSGPSSSMGTYKCSKCNNILTEIGIPPQIQMVQRCKKVINLDYDDTGEQVPEEIKNDPFLYKGLYCPSCKKAFCPPCAKMQSQICPGCGMAGLMPAYRPLLNKIKASGFLKK